MNHNDAVLDYMINQLRGHLSANYVPVVPTAAPTPEDQFVIDGLRKELQEMEDVNSRLVRDNKSAADGIVRRNTEIQQLKQTIEVKDRQLTACHENQKSYREDIAQLKLCLEQKQSQISEANRVDLELREELNAMRKKQFGAAVGVKDVNKLLEQFRSVTSELAALKKQAGIKQTSQEEQQRWDGSIEIGSVWHKDAC